VCHWTVFGAPRTVQAELFTFGFLRRRSAIIHRTVRWATGLSSAPSGATAPSAMVDFNSHCQMLQCAAESERKVRVYRTLNSSCSVRHRTVRCGTGLSGAPRCQSSNGQNRLNPNGWVTCLAHRTVRCAHRQTTSPTVGLVVGAINTPQPPPLQESKFFRHPIQYKS
jgi:hypothetical protein